MSSATCQHHPERAAQGLCVHCRLPLCGECTTKIDGINHCRSCLEARAESAPQLPPRAAVSLPAPLALGLGVAALWLLTWLSLNALLPGAP